MENERLQEHKQEEQVVKPNTKEIWNQLSFEGKSLCKLDDADNIVLLATELHPERIIGTLNPANAGNLIQALCDKFKEVQQKTEELQAEMAQSAEPVKFQGKLQRLKSYLLNANAIGDYQPLLKFVAEQDAQIQNQLKANEEARKTIVEQAVSLKDAEEFKATTEAFRKIVEAWKQAPFVEKEVSDRLWAQIEEARNHFYERKRAFQESVEKEMMQNLDLKLELCEKAEALSQSENWKETAEVYKQLMEQWKNIGRVATAEKNDELWNRFVSAKNIFFDRKAVHQGQIMEEQEANYIAKLKLVELAESIKESTKWKETADQYAAILEDWKAIGRVPYEKAEELWNRMQVAKDYFFNAKRQQAETYKVNLEDNYAQKKALLDRIETLKNSTDWREATQEINELMATWKTIGPIPREYGDTLWEQFIAARQFFFKRKDEDRDARKNRFIQQTNNRLQQSRAFLETIEGELAEDESKLAEFKEILANTADEDAKDREIKSNLVKLVDQIERKIPNRKAKIEDVKVQIAELEQKLAAEK
jgi:hypothetical protein